MLLPGMSLNECFTLPNFADALVQGHVWCQSANWTALTKHDAECMIVERVQLSLRVCHLAYFGYLGWKEFITSIYHSDRTNQTTMLLPIGLELLRWGPCL